MDKFVKCKFRQKWLIFLLVYSPLSVVSQTSNSIEIKTIDSLLRIPSTDTSVTTYNTYLKALKTSKKVNSQKRELKAYFKLMNYFGNKKNLDSMMSYAYDFENIEYQSENKKLTQDFFYNKGAILVSNFEMIEQSLIEFEKAYRHSNPKDLDNTLKIKSFLAYAYINKHQYNKAIDVLTPFPKDSASLSYQAKLLTLTTLAQAYQCLKEPKKSYPANIKALQIAKKNKDSANIYFIKSNIVFDYYLMGHFQKAIDSSLYLESYLKKHYPDMVQINYQNLSISYDTIGKVDNAIFYMNKALNTTGKYYTGMSDYNKVQSLDYLASYYKKLKNYKMTNKILLEKIMVIDSMRAKEQKTFIDYYDTKTRIIDQQKEKEKIIVEKKNLTLRNNKQQQYILILSIGIISLILAITTLLGYTKYSRSKKKIEALQNNEREILKNHINIREIELSTLAANKVKLLSELSNIKQELSEAIKQNKNGNIRDIEQRLNSFLVQTANDTIFSQRLESQYPGMVMTLKTIHPELSQNDIKHCMLVKLGLTLKESAQLMHVGIGAIKMGRNRAKAKMKLSEDISLKQYLDSINNEFD